MTDPLDPADTAGGVAPGAGAPDDSRLRALGIDPVAEGSGRAPSGHDRPIGSATPVIPGVSAAEGTSAGVAAEPGGVESTGTAGVSTPDTPLWLSHHWPDDYDRCAVIGGLHVCRRCLVLYPLALVTGVAVSIGTWWNHSLDPWVLWLMPLPGVIEFVLDNLRVISYRPLRQMLLSAGGAVAAGVGYVRYLDDTTDTLAWTVLAVYTTATLSAAVVGGLWKRRAAGGGTRG